MNVVLNNVVKQITKKLLLFVRVKKSWWISVWEAKTQEGGN